MFHVIAKRKVRQMFDSLSAGEYEAALHGHAPRFEHKFAGDHALGGTRHTSAGLRAWFERLYRLFPNLNFEVNSLAASGPPWDMIVVAEWIDRASPAGGGTYENRGVHVVRLVWGRLASLHAYLDTQILSETLRGMAANGFDEAAAAPIGDPPVFGPSRTGCPRPDIVRDKADHRPAESSPTQTSFSLSLGAVAFGALAAGAVAVGALAIGRATIGKLTVRNAKIATLEIGQLIIGTKSEAPYARQS